MAKSIPLVFLAYIAGVSATFCANPVRTEEPGLELKIAIPYAIDGVKANEVRDIRLYNKDNSFPVVFTNKTNRDLYLWNSSNSWGYYNLSFNVLNANGEIDFVLKKRPATFTVNFPSAFKLKPGDQHVELVAFNDSSWNIDFMSKFEQGRRIKDGVSEYIVLGESGPVTIQAVYDVKRDPTIRSFYPTKESYDQFVSKLWVGKQKSKPDKFNLKFDHNEFFGLDSKPPQQKP